MKRTAPLLITALAGLILVVSSFIPALQRAGEEAAIWFDILAAIAFVLGGANLFRLQLQRVSDHQPGWGYAVVTLVSFTAMLVFGLLKFGAPPEPGVEAYGWSAVPFPQSELPTFSVPLTVPAVRGDGEDLPKSVRRQLTIRPSAAGSELVFTGWMDQGQRKDLLGWQDTLAWRCQSERLAALAVPPPLLAGKIRFDVGHGTLAFAGMMTPEEHQALQQVLGKSPQVDRALAELESASRRVTTRQLTQIPVTFVIPEEMRPVVERTGETISVHGPVSPKLREMIAVDWTHPVRVRPVSPADQQLLLHDIEQRGAALNPHQRTAYDSFFVGDWSPDALVQTLNSAGIVEPEPKSACELLAEIEAGATDPSPMNPAPGVVALNNAQIAVVQQFAENREISWSDLREQLADAGEFTANQVKALESFEAALPTQADHRKALCFRLLETGPLSSDQKSFLLQGSREQFAWRQQIGELFLAAHQTKFPWSGNYSAPDTPFWWLYEYVLQPLMTTTFALLAFYVASAAFRAFRAKNIEAVLLLGTAFIILLGRTSAGPALTSWIPDQFAAFRMDHLTAYIMSIFNTAGNRAIMIGIALGTVSTSLKVLLGIDRSYLGKGDD